jgi:phosphomannomutase
LDEALVAGQRALAIFEARYGAWHDFVATTLTVLAMTGKKLSELIKPIARYAQSGEINFQIEDKDGALAKLKETFAGSAGLSSMDELDGVTIDCFEKQGWWCNVRKSNTEPLLRLNLEARTQELMEQKRDEVLAFIRR